MMNILAAVHFAWYFSFAVIMSDIHPTDHKSITAHNFSEGSRFRKADSEFVESENDNKRFEKDNKRFNEKDNKRFNCSIHKISRIQIYELRFYELNKQQDRVHNVWCLDPVNIERTSLRGFRTIGKFTALP